MEVKAQTRTDFDVEGLSYDCSLIRGTMLPPKASKIPDHGLVKLLQHPAILGANYPLDIRNDNTSAPILNLCSVICDCHVV